MDIFLVDDDIDGLRALSEILAEAGHRVRIANDGATMLRMIEKCTPDLILLDVMMPGFNGHEVCRKLRARPETRDVPVIFLTALDAVPDKLRGFGSGGCDYITKPFHAEEVLARVAHQLRIRQRVTNLERSNEESRQAYASLEAVFDSLETAILILDASSNLLTQNKTASELLAREDGLYLTKSGIRTSRLEESSALISAITRVASQGAAEALSISRPSEGRPLSVLVAPFSAPRNGGENRGRAVLFINHLDQEASVHPAILRTLFGLTPAESRLAILLLNGATVESAASEISVSIHTARTQLKAIFQKTETCSQADLVRLLVRATGFVRTGHCWPSKGQRRLTA